MKRDFMNQFNRLMDTDAPSLDKNGASARNNLSPINRQAYGSNSFSDQGNVNARAQLLEKDITIKQLQVENEELKQIVDTMREEMETVVLQVKEAKLQAEFA
jgi:hypothetical protein